MTILSFAAPELAEGDLRKLQDAGIDAYLGGGYHRHHGPVELQVPQSQVRTAFEILDLEPPSPGAGAASPLACPECRSTETSDVPPYSFRIMMTSVAVAAMLFALRVFWAGLVVLVVGWLGALRFSRRAGNCRCNRCGDEWKPS